MYDFLSDSLRDEDSFQHHSYIKDYFRGKTVLLTGGTGFLGQLYVEKLLRSDVKEVYMIARTKKGKDPKQRFEETFSGPQSSKLKEYDPDYDKRIRIILGDLNEAKVGISETDLEDIYENVNIILHAGADVRFDEKLLKLILTNLRGTRELLRIAENIKNLEVFTYISTAYSNCNRDEIKEEFYKPTVDPESAINLCEQLTPIQVDEFDMLTDLIIKPWPNTYVFTKCLSEDLVRQYGKKFPVIVIRPTIVISTHEDPIPAWSNNIYGLNGCLVACGMGLLRVMPFNKELVGDVICADYVINATLVAIWYTHIEQKKLQLQNVMETENHQKFIEPTVYYAGSSVDNPIYWKEIAEATNRECTKHPPDGAIWKQCENNTYCPFLFWYYSILFHLIPAIIVDAGLSLTSKKIRFLPVYRKVQKFMIALKFFMQKEFKFSNLNLRKALDAMSEADQKYYPSDVRRFDWQQFSYNYVLGIRRYLGKEEPLNHTSYKKYRIFVALHTIFLAIFYGFHSWILWLIIKLFKFDILAVNLYNDTHEWLFNSN